MLFRKDGIGAGQINFGNNVLGWPNNFSSSFYYSSAIRTKIGNCYVYLRLKSGRLEKLLDLLEIIPVLVSQTFFGVSRITLVI